MRWILAGLILQGAAGCGESGPPDTYAFLENYQISRYVDAAASLRKLEPTLRASELRELARDRKFASDVYVLCRMLFEAKPGQEFRRPLIGAASFLGNTTYDDWPLEPIALEQGIPILIVRGYTLAGVAEPPGGYVEYCLSSCAWRPAATPGQRGAVVAKFIGAHPKLAGDAEWLLRQAR